MEIKKYFHIKNICRSLMYMTQDVLRRAKRRRKVLKKSRQDPVSSGSLIRQRRIQRYQKLLTGQ
ncbi:hypothetical protein YC2023_016480 [Brassica napus]